MKARVHVNQHNIKANRRDGKKRPVFTVKTYKSNEYARRVKFNGPVELVYSPKKPLPCGAVAWIEGQREDMVLR